MWGCYTLTVYVSCFALSATMHLTFIDALTIMALGSIGIIAPTPGGIGAYHRHPRLRRRHHDGDACGGDGCGATGRVRECRRGAGSASHGLRRAARTNGGHPVK